MNRRSLSINPVLQPQVLLYFFSALLMGSYIPINIYRDGLSKSIFVVEQQKSFGNKMMFNSEDKEMPLRSKQVSL